MRLILFGMGGCSGVVWGTCWERFSACPRRRSSYPSVFARVRDLFLSSIVYVATAVSCTASPFSNRLVYCFAVGLSGIGREEMREEEEPQG